MVDYSLYNGNYTGTVVRGNTINANTVFIKVYTSISPLKVVQLGLQSEGGREGGGKMLHFFVTHR